MQPKLNQVWLAWTLPLLRAVSFLALLPVVLVGLLVGLQLLALGEKVYRVAFRHQAPVAPSRNPYWPR